MAGFAGRIVFVRRLTYHCGNPLCKLAVLQSVLAYLWAASKRHREFQFNKAYADKISLPRCTDGVHEWCVFNVLRPGFIIGFCLTRNLNTSWRRMWRNKFWFRNSNRCGNYREVFCVVMLRECRYGFHPFKNKIYCGLPLESSVFFL